MRDTIGWQLPPLRDGKPASPELEDRRNRSAGTMPAGEPITETTIGGVRCLLLGADIAASTILYLHGGGYRMGSPVAYIAYARRIAAASDARIVIPFYRLAPEHPFPAALHDAVTVYRELAEEGPVVVVGDSAGGGLSAALAIAAQRAGQPVAGAVLISPMLDLTAGDQTYDSHAASDAYLSRQTVLDCADLYLQGLASNDPLVSPLMADTAAFPPTMLLAGGIEVLLGESLAFASRLALADRRVTLHVAPGMGHVWPMLAPDAAETTEAIAAIAAFVRGLT